MDPNLQTARQSGVSHGEARRAYIASGLGWGLDGLTWTIYGFALTGATVVLGLSEQEVGWITGLSILASAIGGTMGGALADRFGRARVLMWVIVGYSVFTALSATAQDEWQFLLWRILEGLTFGAEWAVGAALVAEYAPASARGRVLAAIQSCYAVGWAVSTGAYLIIFSVADQTTAWRYLFLVGIAPALVAVWIRRKVRDRVDVTKTGDRSVSIAKLFTPAQRRITLLATALGLGAQALYYSIFVFLPTYLAEEKGLTVVGTATYTWVVIVGSFLGYVLSGFVHDTLGRRPAFSLYYIGSAITVTVFVSMPSLDAQWGYPISFLLGFFASGQAGGLGAFLAELFPTEMRAAGQGFSYNVGRGVAGFGPLTVGYMAATIGLGTGIVITCLAGSLLALTVVWMLPETKNRQIVYESELPSQARELVR